MKNKFNHNSQGSDPKGDDVLNLIESMIANGWKRKASELIVNPCVEGVAISLRIGNEIVPIETLPVKFDGPLVRRIKELAGLRNEIHFVPQDGKFTMARPAETGEVGVSITPGHFGEKAVVRLARDE